VSERNHVGRKRSTSCALRRHAMCSCFAAIAHPRVQCASPVDARCGCVAKRCGKAAMGRWRWRRSGGRVAHVPDAVFTLLPTGTCEDIFVCSVEDGCCTHTDARGRSGAAAAAALWLTAAGKAKGSRAAQRSPHARSSSTQSLCLP
jgi:hypothetical protein